MTSEPLILAVETSSRVGSVALAVGARLLAEQTFSAPLRHSAEIFPTVARLLDRFGQTADTIEAVCVSIGPGSFTGLRIAVTMAKAMHLAHNVPVVTVDSLDAIAANTEDEAAGKLMQNGRSVTPPDRIAAVLDAKRGQFYTAVYQRATALHPSLAPDAADAPGYAIPAPHGYIWRKTLPDCLLTAEEIHRRFATDGPLGLLGDGLLYHEESFRRAGLVILDAAYWSPRASRIHALGYQKARAGLFADPLSLAPFYLRGPQVTLKKNA
ncbi:MAG: tRNA (adenosine(37)-N6)-threonylcarbamoyltransferase complex dimerization subunit type 1 TsaB [Sedimentisphaerales bacterium]|nr:tRNA (adenosine(37)-N6)-threonylcarbamoyltransferase complex dimerization subunit type 1 TsaB [Sedimentisphaerales bacterium]